MRQYDHGTDNSPARKLSSCIPVGVTWRVSLISSQVIGPDWSNTRRFFLLSEEVTILNRSAMLKRQGVVERLIVMDHAGYTHEPSG
jgi:hypothetical protein